MRINIEWEASEVQPGERLRFHVASAEGGKGSGNLGGETYIVIYQYGPEDKRYNIVSLADGMIYLSDFTSRDGVARQLSDFNAVPETWVTDNGKYDRRTYGLHSD